MPVYAWKRFWRQLDAEFLTEDNGYLYDPKSLYGTSLNLNSAPLTSFADCPCLVMLGEPGIGKSTEFESEFSRVEQEAALRGDMALRYDLKEYQTDSRLVADAFDNDDIRAWKGEKRLLHLFFDSLDEGRLEVRNIATVIAGQLKRLAAQSDRLRLRIACRTAEWLLTLEQSLKEIWKDENVAIIQLNPLRRLDVIEAARTEGIQSDGFLENIAEKNLQTFAANPITLKFLIDIYRNAGELPSTKHQLYEQGCLRLCEESSLSRRDAGHFGQISAAQRLEIASRIAAVSIFCGRSAIVTSPQFSPSADHLTVVELAGGTEQVSGDQFAVSENAIREALSTTLFSGRGPQRLGFAHRTYAEFLAARYAERRGLDLTQTKSLFFHPECETKIVPQLSETAAWIAIGNRSLFEEIMSGDPLVLLRSDVATTDDQLKARFIARLLNGFDDEEMDDSDWGLRDYYANLKHPQLADQLEPFIRDRTKNRVTRRFVVDIAEKCRETGLLKALLAIALDPSDDAHIRAQAAHAILIIGDRSAYESLKPLALGLAGPDPDDELRGNALTALWPNRLITADELFAALEQPQNPSLIGAYRIFLKVEFPNHLQKDDLEAALRWCRKQAALPDMPGELDQFENAVSEILRKSLSCLADPKIVAAIADCLAALIEHRDHAPIKGELFESLETPARRKIIEALIPKLCNPEEAAFYLVFGHVSLLQAGDFNWLLEQSALADSDHEKRVWAKIARRQFDHRERSQLDQLLANCSSSPIVADVFSDLLQSIDLRSPEATKMRTEHARLQKLEKRSRIRQAPALLEPPPDVRVKNCLDQLEAGDLQGWQLLNRELQLEPSSRLYEFDCEADLTKLPGWIAADESTRSRILAAAKHYLTSWQSNSDAWLGKNVYHFPDFAGYRALVLVDSLEPRFIENLSSSRWVNVAPSIVGFPAYSR